jgi:hypothetical protein
MPVGPYSQDVLTRIYNVHWGGFGAIALFANRPDNQLNVTYYKKTATDQDGEFQSLGFLEFTKDGAVRGCSYGKVETGPNDEPIFLLCGDDGGDIAGIVNGIIMVSNDGLSWSTTASIENIRFLSMTWNPDEKAFFVQAQSWGHGDFTTITCWTSIDGRHWGIGGDDFESHLKYGIYDGQYGFDPSQGKDGHLVLWSDIEPPTGNLTFAGGVWLHTGGETESDLYESIDDTKTWKTIGNFGENSIFPLIAGSWQDVQQWSS